MICEKQPTVTVDRRATAACCKIFLVNNCQLRFLSIAVLFLMFCFSGFSLTAAAAGDDLRAVFARTAGGAPLRVVAIGGSITQAGQGWIGPWLRNTFPRSNISMFNVGMSATGSELGIFRIERDVIASQPDIVLIEFAVNDGSLSDEDAIRYNESIVVRLKQLPHPPAIVFIEVAALNGSNRSRHQKVSRHYNLVDVDLQVKLDEYLKSTGTPWGKVMGDEVHPNEAGHKLYSQWISEALTPYLPGKEKISINYVQATLPPPLSKKPLILDGKLISLAPLNVPGWKRESTLPFWWDMFFTGVLSNQPGQHQLLLNARGTQLGLFYALDKSYGDFRISVDGQSFADVNCHSRGGYSYKIYGKNLSSEMHSIVIQPMTDNTVKLGFLMVAGDTSASNKMATQGPINDTILKNLKVTSIPATAWLWTGPFGGKDTAMPSSDLQTVFPPEAAIAAGAGSDKTQWQSISAADGEFIDFGKISGTTGRGVCYAKTKINSKGGKVLFGVKLDYYGKLWINGKPVITIDGPHGAATSSVYFFAELKAGENEIIAKIHSGSKGYIFALCYEDTFAPTLPDGVIFQ